MKRYRVLQVGPNYYAQEEFKFFFISFWRDIRVPKGYDYPVFGMQTEAEIFIQIMISQRQEEKIRKVVFISKEK